MSKMHCDEPSNLHCFFPLKKPNVKSIYRIQFHLDETLKETSLIRGAEGGTLPALGWALGTGSGAEEPFEF